jgi:hypothetical protein
MVTKISEERSTLKMQETCSSEISVTKKRLQKTQKTTINVNITVRTSNLWNQNDGTRMRKSEMFYL